MTEISVQLAGTKFENPLQCASGSASNLGGKIKKIALEGKPGAIVTKSISVDMGMPWGRGSKQPTPRCWPWIENQPGMVIVSARGEPFTCQDWFARELPIAIEGNVPIIGNASGAPDLAQWPYLAQEFEKAGCCMVELNFGTPHAHEWGHGAVLLYMGVGYDIVKAVKEAVSIPVMVKLPYLNEADCIKYGKELERVGADALKVCMPLGAMTIDIETGMPPMGIGTKTGIIGGPPHKPLALMNVFVLAQHVSLPIVGSGGVCNGRDVIEYIMAGASAVEIATWMMIKGPKLFKKINREIIEWMEKKGFSSLNEIRGMAIKYAGVEEYWPDNPYYAVVDETLCNGCGQCETLCTWVVHELRPAIAVDKSEKKAVVNLKECQGCGFCVSHCPQHAISLKDWGKRKLI